jgi:hypothetical protein
VRKISLPVLIGAIACLCYLTACGAKKNVFTAGGDAPSLAGCKAWEVKIGPVVNGVTRIEVGWEPLATSNGILLRRCAK